jgi:hypothetical protein
MDGPFGVELVKPPPNSPHGRKLPPYLKPHNSRAIEIVPIEMHHHNHISNLDWLEIPTTAGILWLVNKHLIGWAHRRTLVLKSGIFIHGSYLLGGATCGSRLAMDKRAWHRRQRWCVGTDAVAAVAEGGSGAKGGGLVRLWGSGCTKGVASGWLGVAVEATRLAAW